LHVFKSSIPDAPDARRCWEGRRLAAKGFGPRKISTPGILPGRCGVYLGRIPRVV
jgi:hypothetical protein